MQFLHEKNVAGQTLLRLVARGNAIVAEILRLADHVPEPFKLDTKETEYKNLVIDFTYLEGREAGKGPDYYERIIEQSASLLELDAQFKDTFQKKLRRFYNLFEVIWKYGQDFVTYIDDVDKGNYIQNTLEGILLDADGKQLMCEALYLFGVMLLLLDQKIDGVVRERMLISYLRYTGQNQLENFDEVANLVERTGYNRNNPLKKPPSYPEKYLSRRKLPSNAVRMIIGRLRSDDIYNQIPNYPLPEHRSTALATQAQMLWVCLYFAPEILKTEESVMREIVDKHFPDNWVVPLYLGYVVDLTEEWEPYLAAKMALANTTQQRQIVELVNKHIKSLPKIFETLDFYLQEGTLTEDYILQNKTKLMECLRAANVTLRWIMLHSRKSAAKIKTTLMKDVNQAHILVLLLKTAQFEFKLKTEIKNIINQKKEKWEAGRKLCCDRVKELSEVFAGTKPLTNVEPNTKLRDWFTSIATAIEKLDFEEKTVSGRRIQQIITALEEVLPFHRIETNVPVKSFLMDTGTYLANMVRLVNISDDTLLMIDFISDVSYAREIVYDYINEMQDKIKADPGTVLLLRSTFLKLSDMLQIPLYRIGQISMGSKEAMDKEFIVVSEYYSRELVNFVRTVLQIVPDMMFRKLAQIINIQTNQFLEVPMRIEKQEIEKYAQLPVRNQLSELTFEVSQFTEGILALETTLVGVINVEPKKLLEEGIRKILVKYLVKNLDAIIKYEKNTIEEFEGNLSETSKVLGGFRRSFTYIQDYINIYGLKIWQEEFQRIINFFVEQECNRFFKKIDGTKSLFQSKVIPIPTPAPVKNDISVNFMGRLARALLTHTDPRNTVYLHKMSAWYTRKQKEVVSIKTFDMLINSVGVFGVTGLTKFYGYSIVKDLQVLVKFFKELRSSKTKFTGSLGTFLTTIQPLTSLPPNAIKLYQNMLATISPISVEVDKTCGSIAALGQKQLLRRHIANILSFKCKLDSNPLYCSLEVLNKALINDIRAYYRDPINNPYPNKKKNDPSNSSNSSATPTPDDDDENPLLFEVASYLEHMGLNDPFVKIYVAGENVDDFSAVLFFFVLRQAFKFSYDGHLGNKPSTDKKQLDDTPFVVGVITLIHQFQVQHRKEIMHEFLGYIGQFIRSYLDDYMNANEAKGPAFPEEVVKIILFLEILSYMGNIPRTVIEEYVPAYIFAEYKG